MLNDVGLWSNDQDVQLGLLGATIVFSGDSERYLLSDGIPFVIDHRLYGDVYIFTDTYIDKLLIAYDTDCIKTMSSAEIDVTFAYHNWLMNGSLSGKPAELFYSLDAKMRSLVTCADVPSIDDCAVDYQQGYVPCQ